MNNKEILLRICIYYFSRSLAVIPQCHGSHGPLHTAYAVSCKRIKKLNNFDNNFTNLLGYRKHWRFSMERKYE